MSCVVDLNLSRRYEIVVGLEEIVGTTPRVVVISTRSIPSPMEVSAHARSLRSGSMPDAETRCS